MGLESGTYIDDFVITNPTSGDPRSQGDNHLRLIKELLQNTFPNADKAFYFPTTEAKTADFTVADTDLNKTFMVNTSGGEVTATLPTLGAGDAGWECHFIKTNTDAIALFIAPASGTLQSGEVSGLAKCRRCIPGHRSTARWSGSAWYISRVLGAPIGSCLEFHGTSLPVGYEWPTGATLASASTKYPEFYAVNGNSGVTLDRQERVAAMADKTGVSRLTDQSGGVSGTFGDTGGGETATLVQANLPDIDLTAGSSGDHMHTVDVDHNANSFAIGSGGPPTANSDNSGSDEIYTTSTSGAHQHTVPLGGSDTPVNLVQPTIIVNFILVVE